MASTFHFHATPWFSCACSYTDLSPTTHRIERWWRGFVMVRFRSDGECSIHMNKQPPLPPSSRNIYGLIRKDNSVYNSFHDPPKRPTGDVRIRESSLRIPTYIQTSFASFDLIFGCKRQVSMVKTRVRNIHLTFRQLIVWLPDGEEIVQQARRLS